MESAPNARLIIRKLSLENFKSYAGCVELGPFHKKFCCVVGPNGSGKSNVIDALLFVFGFRATKIRLKKLSMLIHNSDERCQNINSCSVIVHFAQIIDSVSKTSDPDEFTVVPGSEFKISRTAYRDNTSTYYIDSKRSNFKEVTELLKSKHVDLDHNRFLILQGEVEQISQMKPKGVTEHDEGLLEYLEDIIGTFIYKEKISAVEVEANALEDSRQDQLKRVTLVENEKNDLEKEKNAAVAFLELENKITLIKHQMMQKYSSEVACSMQTVQSKYEELKTSLEEKYQAQKEIEQEMSSSKTAKDAKCRDLKVANDKLEDLQSQFAEIDQQDVKQRSDFKNAKESIPKLMKSVEDLKRKIEDTKNVPGEKTEELSKLEEDLKNVEERREQLELEYSAAMQTIDTKTLQRDKEAKLKVLLAKNEVTNKCKADVDRAEGDLEILNNTRNRLKAQMDEAKLGFDKTTTELNETNEQLASLPLEVKTLTASVENSKKRIPKILEEEKQLYSQIQTVRSELETAKSSVNQNQSKGRQLTALLKERDLGNISGIVGRLGDLGSINEKYDVAISTACPQLDFVVVDNMDTAKKCVQLLKERNLGMATFLGLDKMREHLRNSQRSIQVPNRTVRLFDQVNIKNPEHAGAFYYALRDTLVADSIEQARQVALHGSQRWRVVTLGGQLVELSGTMSGGGGRVARGLMSNKSNDEFSPAQIAEMEKREASLKQQYEKCLQEKADLEAKLDSDQRNLKQKENSLRQIDQKINLLKDRLKSYEMRMKKTETELKSAEPDPVESKRINSALTKLKQEYEKASEASNKVQNEVDKLNEQIQDVANRILNPIKAKQQKCTQDKQSMTAQVSKARTALKSAEKNLKKMQTQLDEDQKELERLTGIKNNLKSLMLESEQKAKVVLEQIEVCKNSQKEIEVGISGVNEILTKLQSRLDESKQANLSLQHECGQLSAKMKDQQAQINNYNKQIGSLNLNVEECEPCELRVLSEEELQSVDIEVLQQDREQYETELKKLKPNLASIEAFKTKYAQYLEKVDVLDRITSDRDSKRAELGDLRARRLSEFMAGFSNITLKLKEMYQMITLGGDAELELVDSLDPFSEGVVFSVRPPKKSWKNISNLSGGEKTLSSLALVFALHHYKPTPFYFMDEIDAALDFKNVSIIANYIEERTSDAQFIIISLRSQMFELADQLVGIYKTNNATKSVAIVPKVILRNARAQNALNNAENKDTNKILDEETMSTRNFPALENEVGRENVEPENAGGSTQSDRTAESMETETVI